MPITGGLYGDAPDLAKIDPRGNLGYKVDFRSISRMSREALSRTFDALGSGCEIYAIDQSERALDAAVAWTLAQHHRLTRFEPESELSHFNATPGLWVSVSAVLEALLRVALDAFERSGGLVHAGVLPALRAAGYTRTFRDGPTECSLDGAKPPLPLPQLLEVEPGWAKLAPGAATDLEEISVLARTGTEAEVLAKTALLMGRGAAAGWLEGRATGIASFLALFIAILSGIALRTSVLDWLGSNRALKALHTFSTVLWIPLGLLHLITLLVDKTARIALADLVVPFGVDYGTGDARTAIGFGTVAFDIFIVVTVTSWLRHRMEQRLWSWIHRPSYVAFGLTFAHAFLSGTDFNSPLISALSWSLAFAALVLALARIVWGRLPA